MESPDNEPSNSRKRRNCSSLYSSVKSRRKQPPVVVESPPQWKPTRTRSKPSSKPAPILEPSERWDVMFALFLSYRREFQTVMVPQKKEYRTKLLGNWVHEQRKRYKKGKMRPDHLERLERVGFKFCPRAQDAQRGSDPRYEGHVYEMPAVEVDADGHVASLDGMAVVTAAGTTTAAAPESSPEQDLYAGVDENCDDFMLVDFKDDADLFGVSPGMFQDETNKLLTVSNSMSMEPPRQETVQRPNAAWGGVNLTRPGVWSPVTVKQSKRSHPDTKPKATEKPPTTTSRPLPSINSPKLLQQIRACLPPASVAQQEQHFYAILDRLQAYKAKHGDTRVPRAYEDSELGEWVNAVRKRLRSKTLPQHHFDLLNKMGFSWSLDSGRNEVSLVLEHFTQAARTLDTLVSPLQQGPKSRRVSVEDGKDNVAPKETTTSSECLAQLLLSPALVPRTPNALPIDLDSLTTRLNASASPSAHSSGNDYGTRRKSSRPQLSRIQTLFPRRPMSGADYDNLDDMVAMLCQNRFLKDACQRFLEQQSTLADPLGPKEEGPVYLDAVLNRITARQYEDCRSALDNLCRVFDQYQEACSQAPSTRVPAFIMAHLKTYILMLWQEYMLSSDAPKESDPTFPLYEERDQNRSRQLQDSALLPLNTHILSHFCEKLRGFLASGGRLDGMDSQDLPSLGDVNEFESKLNELVSKLSNLIERKEFDYQFQTLHHDLLSCAPESSPLRDPIKSRLSRLFWKLGAPIHEANSRGADASSIWADAANTLWARDGPRKPYWPALCLGVIVSSDKVEPWQPLITERNEARLSSHVATQLAAVRRNCELTIRKDGGCFMLVELLGIHEFRWVAGEDVMEFDEENDPNENVPGRCSDRRHKQLLPKALQEVNAAAAQNAAALESIFD